MALTDNLVSYYKQDEASGNALDAHGSNELTDTATVGAGTGKINGARDFEESNAEYFTISDASQSGLDITGSLSIAGWINLEELPATNGLNSIMGKASAYDFGISRPGGTLGFRLSVWNSSTENRKETAWTIAIATWYHVATVYDAAAQTIKFYVNGSQQGSTHTGVVSSIDNSSGAFFIGNGHYNTKWDGLIDEIGIWSRALTASEVSDLYGSGSGLAYPFSAEVSAGVGILLGSGPSSSIVPGQVSINGGPGILAGSGPSMSITPGSISVSAGVGSGTFFGLSAEVDIGAVILAAAGILASSGPAVAIVPGSASVSISPGILSSSGPSSSLTPGEATIAAGVAELISSGLGALLNNYPIIYIYVNVTPTGDVFLEVTPSSDAFLDL